MSKPVQNLVRYSGGSMWPCFQEGDLLEVVPVRLDQVCRGDCVVYRSGDGRQVIHRVVSAGSTLKTRGDAVSRDDSGVVIQEQLVGKVTRRYRLGMGKRVTGGWPGALAGRFYFLAGRIDPLRPSRGGHLARQLRTLSVSMLGWMGSPGEVHTVALPEQPAVIVWYWGRRVIGRQETPGGEWFLYWPWRVVFERWSRNA